jgi:hypothetical protein
MKSQLIRRLALSTQLALLTLAGCALVLPSCAGDGHLTLLGYSTKPNYDPNIHTVSVPIFKNRTNWTVTPAVGMEMDLTRAVIREIEGRTPFKVVQCNADTELRGTIVAVTKTLLNYTPHNNIREAELNLSVDLVWKDLRSGRILSRPARRGGELPDPAVRQPLLATPDSLFPPGAKPIPVPSIPALPETGAAAGAGVPGEDVIIDPNTNRPVVPINVHSIAHYRPELGESITTALQKNYERMATQIVNIMEQPW